ncbi:MAG: S8 family serine peptidase [Bacteroidales bacterium]
MRKISTYLSVFVLFNLIIICIWPEIATSQVYKSGVMQGTIRIKMKPELMSAMKITKSTGTGIISTGISTLDRLNDEYKVTEMKRVFRYSPAFEEKHKKYGLNLWYEITIDDKKSALDVVKAYSQLGEISIAEPIREKKLIDGSTAPVYLSSPLKTTDGAPYFDDPYLPRQWHYNNTGQSGGTPGSDINLYKAWDITKGSQNVIVSIHDQGIEVTHEDLKDAMWINEAELNGVTNVDDDGNGYKDDIYGFNFASNKGTIDGMYHGTHVAGTVGAVNNNGTGVSGIAGGSGNGNGVRLMSCQILGGTGSGNTPDSYIYAADMGALISQNSWGYQAPEYFEQAVLDAIDYFIAEAGSYSGSPMKGGVVIFAAGNSSYDAKWYPGYYDQVISVAALNSSSHLTVYSNYGDWVDISAPGGQEEDNANIDPTSPFKNGVLSTLDNNSYGFMDGTSMACPHVSGVAALIVSKFGGSGFTANDLKNRLLTGTRFLDSIAYNQPYAGKLGSGSLDAELALATDNKIAPEKINNLELTGIAQDFANLKWNVPTDQDDKKPVQFEVFYSTQQITPANINTAKLITLNTMLEPGEQDSVEIPYLKALTTYYFAVRSTDRWGNKSELSNQVTGTTNAGPDAQIDPNISSLDFTIDITQNPVQELQFGLLNNGEGLLKWSAETHQKYAYPSSVKNINLPVIQSFHYSNGKNLNSNQAKEASKMVPFAIDNPTYSEHSYLDPNTWSLWVVGETDTTYTNSSATRYYIDNAEGFNLTEIDAFLVHKESTGPIILEVYEGQQIDDARLMYRQEVSYSSDYGYTPIQLEERLFFEQGKYFWIVFHVPSMNLYPLGAGLEANKEDSKNCYYSSDLGKTWASFEDVYYDNQLVWAVYAISTYENLDQYIVLNPLSGTVSANNSETISATVDATNMINGDYSAKIAISTNETNEPLLGLPVNLSITGHKPVIKSLNRIDAGGVLVGAEKTFDINLQNTGLGRFQFESYGYDADWNPVWFDISNSQFSYVSGLNSYFDAKTEQTVRFKFKPSMAGNSTSIVHMQDNKGNTYSFELFGYGIDPPVMEISPLSNTTNNVAIGDVVTGQITISNTGNYPLDYYVPAFADGSNMEYVPANVHKFGYTKEVNPEGLNPSPVYNWTDISTTGTNISSQLNAWDKRFFQVDLGFEFPFFGKNETSVYVSRYSTLSFDTEGYIWSRNPIQSRWEGLPDRIISVLGYETEVETKGQIYYQRFPDKFIVQWENISISGFATGSYQVVLHDNGNINVYIKSLVSDSWISWDDIASQVYIGIEDQTKNDGLLVTDYGTPYTDAVKDNSAIEFVSPGQGLFTTLTNPYGSIQPGSSATLDYTINTENLYVADYTEKLTVISNDPVNNPGLHTANFSITSGGVPDVTISETDMNFGNVFLNDSKHLTFFMSNKGKAPVTITGVTFDNNYYTIDGNYPQELKPGRSLFFNVSINTSNLGIYADNLTLNTSEPNTYVISLTGEVVEAPEFTSDITDINEVLASGETKAIKVTIGNPGGHDLDLAFKGNSWMYVTDQVTKEVPVIQEYTYVFRNSLETEGPVFNWTDITSEANKVEVGDIWSGENPWTEKIALPFSFNFYGNTYDSIYIGYNGLVSFTPNQELNAFGGDAIPDTISPNNYIAALYGFIGPSWVEEYPNSGYYYQADQDKAVIQFTDFNTGFGMSGPMSLQIILYKSGNIKYQYKMHFPGDGDAITGFGSIGVENADGTDGVQISYYNSTSRDGLAYELYPVKKYTVAAGQNKEFNIILDAKEQFAGQYNDNLVVINNAPASQGFSIPVSLTVTGAPEIVVPDSVGLGDLLVIETPDDWSSPYKSYEKEFEVSNSGTAKAEILQFDRSKMYNSTVYAWILGDGWFGPEYMWMDVANLPMTDWNTWETIPLYLEPKTTMKFKVSMMPVSQGPIKDTLAIITDAGTYNVAMFAEAYMPPVMAVSADTIKVFAQNTSHTEIKDLILDNTAGGYELTYNTEIDYKRTEKSAVSESSEFKSAKESLLLKSYRFEKPISVKKGTKAGFNRELSYESAQVPETALGYGGSSAFYSATAFQAPSDGFNLTDVQTWYRAGDWLKSKIVVNIYSGSNDIYKAKLVHSQTYDYNLNSPNIDGEMLTIHLDKNILLYPNEYFFVSFGYESGAVYPQGVVTMANRVQNRYLYGNGNGTWYDIADAGTGLDLYGWMVRALEENFQSAAWVSVSTPLTDTIAQGETGTVSLDFNAAFAKPGDNLADLIINSNDPAQLKKKVTLLLHLNNGPEFKADKTLYDVFENGTISFNVEATDVEGDNFTLALKDKPSFVTGTVSGNTMGVTCNPTYDDAGEYVVTVEGTDALNNKTEIAVNVVVKNVNRAPVVVDPIASKGMDQSEMPVMNLAEIIADPDGEVLEYEVTSSNEAAIKIYLASDGLIITAVTPGKSTITITGTDAAGLSATHSFEVSAYPTGFENLSTDKASCYPNPTKGKISLLLPELLRNDALIKITSLKGNVVYDQLNSTGEAKQEIDLSNMTDGIYLIKISKDDNEQVLTVIKN